MKKNPGDKNNYYPLTHAQKRIYYEEKKYPGTGWANIAFLVKYIEDVDFTLLSKAINQVIRTNDGIRLRIVEFDFEPEPSQYVSPYKERTFVCYDFSGPSGELILKEWLENSTKIPFELIDHDLFYFACVRFDEDEGGYYLKLHHIIFDGWGFALLSEEINRVYEMLKNDRWYEDDPGPSYLQYIADEQEYLKSGHAERDREFWQETMLPLPEATSLSLKRGDPANITANKCIQPIPDNLRTMIHNYCSTNKTSLFKLILSALSLYISKLTGLDDIIVGSVNHNRSTERQKKTVGMFVSTFLLRIKIDGDTSFHHLAAETGKMTNCVIKNHQKYPFDLLATGLKEITGVDIGHLADISLTGHSEAKNEAFGYEYIFPGYLPQALLIHINISKKNRGRMELEWEYQVEKFSELTIRRFHGGLSNVLFNALANPMQKISDIETLSAEEKKQIVHHFNDTKSEYPNQKTIHELFEEQVEITPGKVALVFEDMHITYKMLDKRANQLGNYLYSDRNLKPEEPVGISMERSFDLITAMLGVLKAGGAYVPIELSFPVERIKQVINDAAIRILISQEKNSRALRPLQQECVNLETGEMRCSSKPLPGVKPGNTAYIIYTSGSTGAPKGVVVEHQAIVNTLAWRKKHFQLDQDVVNLQIPSFSFDASVEDIFTPLISGGRLILIREKNRVNFEYISKALKIYCATHFIMISTLYTNFLREMHESLTGIKAIAIGGDKFSPSLVSEHFDKLPSVKLYNEYGPTENSVCSTIFELNRYTQNILIGKPIYNVCCIIITKDDKLCPIGMPGELCIGGAGLARGYLNRPQLTVEKFIDNPFAESGGMYRSGDLARWMPDGNIEFLGRLDSQTKIRGYRIEPAEIESKLLAHREIKEAIVVTREDSPEDKYLCAYIVSDEIVNILSVRNALAETLPPYMLPSYFMQLEKIPQTPGGKVDRKALPSPTTMGAGSGYPPPGNRIEVKLAEIWADVLKMERKRVGIDDNFFELGGHSLKAAVVLAKIHKILNVKLSTADIFKMPTIRNLAKHIKGVQEVKYAAIQPAEKKEYYPQSSAQKRLYVIQQMAKKSTNYNIMRLEMPREKIEKEKLENIFKILMDRHESFRTSFFMKEGEAVQKIHDHVEFGVQCFETMEGRTQEGERRRKFDDGIWKPGERRKYGIDRRNKSVAHNASEVITKFTGKTAQEIINEFVRPFDLGSAPLLRVGLITIRGTRQILLVDVHHIVADGVSIEEMEKEFKTLLNGDSLPPLKLQYKDFAVWQNSERKRNVLKEEEKFWLKEFGGEVPILNLPADFPRPPVQEFKGDTLHFAMSSEQAVKLKTLARRQGATLYMILLAAFNVLLSKLSDQEEVIVGTVTAGRRHADLYRIIGMFANTLVLKNYPKQENAFDAFLGEVKERTIAAFENEDYQFEDLVSKVSAPRDTSRNPLFDVSFGFLDRTGQTGELLESADPGGIKPYGFAMETAKFDLTLMGTEIPEEVQFGMEYNSRLFKEETIRRFINYFREIIDSIIRKPDREIKAIDMIPDNEKNRLLDEFNRTSAEYPRGKTIHRLFEEQVSKSPDRTAVVGRCLIPPGTPARAKNVKDKEHLSYNELDRKAGQLARVLRRLGVEPDEPVVIMVEPSIEMIIGLLSISKAGGAFLPIADGTPAARVSYILEESGSRVFLTRKELPGGIPYPGEAVFLDCEGLNPGEAAPPPPANTPGDLAYCIYTSGSSGKPKGVMIEHGALVNLCTWHNTFYAVTPRDRSAKYAGFAFDASVWEIFPYLIAGAALFIVPEEIKLNIDALNRYFEYNDITVTFLPTQVCEQFMTVENASLRVLLTGGDKLKTYEKRKYRLFNNYGPTENAVVATSFEVTQKANNIPIGKPVFNNRIYILDPDDNPRPIGVPGELCIGGESLARGYLNLPKLTAEKFTSPAGSPSDTNLTTLPLYPSTPLYRTGDLARWLPEGDIEFLGRIDTQVKIRGFRIEPGEIETQLKAIRYVKDAVVIDRKDVSGEKYLCAYMVLKPGMKVDGPPPAEKLTNHLPGYMIPAYFMEIDAIPLTPNGKVDRDALPDPKTGTAGQRHEAPRNKKEQILAKIWEQVLGVEKVGINDDFFHLGGDSIKAIQIISRLQKQRLKLELHMLFRQKNIKRTAKYVKPMDMHREEDLPSPDENAPLTPIQEWFFSSELKYSHHFNQSILLYREKGFDEIAVRKTVSKIIDHHDALRLTYRYDRQKKKIIQEMGDSGENPFHMEVVAIDKTEDRDTKIKREAQGLQGSMDLRTGPLVKLCLFKGDNGDFLLIIIHHLVVDGVSWRILLEDFETGYRQAEQGNEIQLQQKTDSYHRWSVKLSQYAESGKLSEQLPFWKTVEDTHVEKLPVDHKIGDKKKINKNVDPVSMTLESRQTTKLLTNVNWAYNTEINDILLAALGMAVNKWCGVKKVLINLEGHGREKIMENVNIHRTVGWFTSQYPVVLDICDPAGSGDISFAIKNVKETLRRIPDKGAGYGILKYLTPAEKRESLIFTLEPEISFNYLGQFDRGTQGVIDEIIGLSDPRMGHCISPDFKTAQKIDISGEVTNGTLKLYFFHNRYEYERETMERLVGLFKQELEAIIAHCTAREERELTASDLGYTRISMDTLQKITGWVRGNVGEEAKIQAIFGLTPMQREIFCDTMLNKEAYFIQNILGVPGGADLDGLKINIGILNRRYEAARTIFMYDERGEILQVVVDKRNLDIKVHDISHLPHPEQQRVIEAFKKEDKKRGFDVTCDQLVRLTLFRTGEDFDIFVWSLHHIVMDGWCFPVIMDDLTQLYDAMDRGITADLGPAVPFSTYVDWLELQDREEGLEFWGDYLAGYDRSATLTTLGSRGDGPRYQLEEYYFTIDEILSDGLTHRAAASQVTLNILFQALWGILLQKYTGSGDVVFGAIVSGRPPEIEGIERMIGLFINIVPVRVKTGKTKQLPELLKKIQRQSLMSKLYETLSLSEILENASLEPGAIDNLIFFENYPVIEEGVRSKIKLLENHEQINYPFNFFVLPGRPIKIRFSYNGLVFNRELIQQIAVDFQDLVLLVAENSEREIDELVNPA